MEAEGEIKGIELKVILPTLMQNPQTKNVSQEGESNRECIKKLKKSCHDLRSHKGQYVLVRHLSILLP